MRTTKKISFLIETNIPVKFYASCAGKVKLSEESKSMFTKEERNNVVDNHAHFLTDFNIIYENTFHIRIYQIAALYTKSTEKSILISNAENYIGETKSQNIHYFPEKVLIKSVEFFKREDIKAEIEASVIYQKFFTQVKQELDSCNIPYRVAEKKEDVPLTGYNILLRMQDESLDHPKDYMKKIKISVPIDEK